VVICCRASGSVNECRESNPNTSLLFICLSVAAHTQSPLLSECRLLGPNQEIASFRVAGHPFGTLE
jgi:hypothetical protein